MEGESALARVLTSKLLAAVIEEDEKGLNYSSKTRSIAQVQPSAPRSSSPDAQNSA